MRYWLREIAGWLLVGLGLYLFLVCTSVLLDPEIKWVPFLQIGPLIAIGFIIFRGGIHVLKVAVAARVCMKAQAEMARPEPTPARQPSRPAAWEE